MSVSLLLLNLPPLKLPYGVKFSLNVWKLPQNVTRLYIDSPPPWKGFWYMNLRYLWFILDCSHLIVPILGVWLDMIRYKKTLGDWGLMRFVFYAFRGLTVRCSNQLSYTGIKFSLIKLRPWCDLSSFSLFIASALIEYFSVWMTIQGK